MASLLTKAFVDRLFSEMNLDDLYWAISVVERQRQLPEEFWLFSRMYEWAPARSGVWQYYEALRDEQFLRISSDLDRFGLAEIAEKYCLGRSTCNDSMQAAELDTWLDQHANRIHQAVFELIAPKKDYLTQSS